MPDKDLRELREKYIDSLESVESAGQSVPPSENTEPKMSLLEKAEMENWALRPLSSNNYFYEHIALCLFSQWLISGAFETIFRSNYLFNESTSSEMVNLARWGLIISVVFHIFRWIPYRYTSRRIKSAYPVKFFIFIWFCIALFLNGWNFQSVYTNLWSVVAYVLLMSPLLIYWRRLENGNTLLASIIIVAQQSYIARKIENDDRLAMIWFLGANWFLSVLFALPSFGYRILMLICALAAYGITNIHEGRIREGFYWRDKSRATDSASLPFSFAVVTLLVWIGLVLFTVADMDNNRQLLVPISTAFHFAVSSFLASEYLLYTLSKCELIKLVNTDGRIR